MTHPLDGAFERVTGAGEHIDALTAAIKKSGLELEQAVLDGLQLDDLHFSLESPYLPLSPHLQHPISLPLRWAVLVGETIYNLRAALDYLVYELALKDSGRIQQGTQFPITFSAKEFKDQASRLRGVSAPHVTGIEALQPYPDRPDRKWLAALWRLSNPDKHRALTSTPGIGIGHVALSMVDLSFLNDGRPVRVAKDVTGQTIYVQYPYHLGVLIEDGTVENVLGSLRDRTRETLEDFRGEF
jgi:hypothetical protein